MALGSRSSGLIRLFNRDSAPGSKDTVPLIMGLSTALTHASKSTEYSEIVNGKLLEVSGSKLFVKHIVDWLQKVRVDDLWTPMRTGLCHELL